MKTDDYLPKIKSFGALGYDPERIADLLNLSGDVRTELIMRLDTPGDLLAVAYNHGRAIGEYNIDVEVTKMAEGGDPDAVELVAARAKARKMKDMKKLLFGV